MNLCRFLLSSSHLCRVSLSQLTLNILLANLPPANTMLVWLIPKTSFSLVSQRTLVVLQRSISILKTDRNCFSFPFLEYFLLLLFLRFLFLGSDVALPVSM